MVRILLLLWLIGITKLTVSNAGVLTTGFVKTFPEDKIAFSKGHVIKCASECQKLKCSCFRMNIDDPNICNFETEISRDPPEKKMVYFAMDRFSETLEKDEYLVGQSGNSSSWGKGSQEEDKSSYSWLQIKLDSNYTITGLAILSTSGKHHHFSIYVGSVAISSKYNSQAFDQNPTCNKLEEHRGSEKDVLRCQPCPLKGEYVIIQSFQENNRKIPQAGDVKIYGLKVA